jgi:hypothetical protein
VQTRETNVSCDIFLKGIVSKVAFSDRSWDLRLMTQPRSACQNSLVSHFYNSLSDTQQLFELVMGENSLSLFGLNRF